MFALYVFVGISPHRESEFEYRAAVIVPLHSLIELWMFNCLPVAVYIPFPVAAFEMDLHKFNLNLSNLNFTLLNSQLKLGHFQVDIL